MQNYYVLWTPQLQLMMEEVARFADKIKHDPSGAKVNEWTSVAFAVALREILNQAKTDPQDLVT